MKAGRVFVILAVVLAVVGAGLSYADYSGSLQVPLVLSQPITATSTVTVATTSRELVLTTTSSTKWILQDEIISLSGLESSSQYCGWVDSRHVYLEAGQTHVSYHTDRKEHVVDFWMMNEADYTRWGNLRYCSEVRGFHGNGRPFVAKLSNSGYEFTADVPSAGTYYFAFMNGNPYSVDITLNADMGVQTSEVTITRETTYYSTQEKPYVTEQVTPSTGPGGFGVLFYAGIGLIAVAAIALVVSRTRSAAPRTERVPPATAVAQRAPAVSPSPSAPSTGKFCMNCGAPLPARATFCNECGLRQ